MNPVTGTVEEGRIVVDGQIEWPNGTRVEILPCKSPQPSYGIEESEWRNDPEALADWTAWIHTFEPVEFSVTEEAELTRFREQMKQFNIEAVRRQMKEGIE